MSSSSPQELVSQEQAVFPKESVVRICRCCVSLPLSPRDARESLTSPGFWDLLSMSLVPLRDSFFRKQNSGQLG